jgi:ketosteroid isomerase-like protein
MGDDLLAVAASHVEAFNRAVASADFAPLVALFAEDATLEFVGAPVGPLVGRPAIAAGYAERPPTDTLAVLSISVEGGVVVEPFSWSADRGARSGEMRLEIEDGLIRRLVVAFG